MSTILSLPSPAPSHLEQKQNKKKEELVEQLKKAPIVQIACEKVGIGRATFYRWRKEDKAFAESVEQAINDGDHLVSDMAESKLISAIKKENLAAIIFWLKSHHPKYRTKLQVDANIRNLDESLTPEQEALVREALRLAGANQIESENNEQYKSHTIEISGSHDQRSEGQNLDH